MLCVLVSSQLYARLNTISNRIWICVAIIYHLQIQINYLLFCDHCDPEPMTKLISNL
jgi:hypothetical protein